MKKQLTLCPIPKSVRLEEGRTYRIPQEPVLSVSNDGLKPAVTVAMDYFACKAFSFANGQGDISIDLDSDLGMETYTLTVRETGIAVTAGGQSGVFYALMTLHQLMSQCGGELPCLSIEDEPYFSIRGYMLDISRDKIPTLQTLKERVDDLCAMKINHLQLYFEGAPFAYRDYPDMWQGLEVLQGEEIRELDAYCKARFVELLPAQNTFGHMGLWLFDGGYHALAECPHGFINPNNGSFCPWPMCLDPNDPEAFRLVRNISDDLLSWFSTDKYNVCCDETIELGWGKSKALCEKVGIGRVYFDYLMKLYAYCKEKGKTMLFWADIINEYPEIVAELPRDILALNWGYYGDLPREDSCINFEKNGIPYCVCPGTAAWNTQIGNIPQMVENIRTTVMKGVRHHAVGVVNTEWGDGGHWQGAYSAYPGIAYGAAMSWQPEINEGLDIAAVLSKLIFRDSAEKIGEIFMQAGDFMSREGVEFENTSHAQMLLRGDLHTYRLPEKLSHKDFDAVTAHLLPLLSALEETQLAYPDGETVVEELRCGIRLILTAQDIGRYHLHQAAGERSQALACAKRVEGGLNGALTGLTKLWMKKNKVSRLYRAMSPLKHNLDAVQKILYPENIRPQ